jgi:hypothetical protein
MCASWWSGILPAECRERETWRYVAGALDEAARGGESKMS